jgi:hypothetical protein
MAVIPQNSISLLLLQCCLSVRIGSCLPSQDMDLMNANNEHAEPSRPESVRTAISPVRSCFQSLGAAGRFLVKQAKPRFGWPTPAGSVSRAVPYEPSAAPYEEKLCGLRSTRRSIDCSTLKYWIFDWPPATLVSSVTFNRPRQKNAHQPSVKPSFFQWQVRLGAV